jgi:hypothetical protein
LVLAIEGFDAHTFASQASLRRELLALVVSAAREPDGLRWDDFQVDDQSDGTLILILPAFSPVVKLAGPFIATLNQRLAGNAPEAAALPPMRLRVALHLGLAERDGPGWSGEGVDLARCLVRAGPAGAALRAAHRAHLAFIVSDDTHDSVIRHEYRLIDPAAYAAVRFDAGQGTAVTGWITVPGYPSPPGIEPDRSAGQPGPAESSAGPAAGRPAPNPAARLVSQHVDVVHGDNIGIQINNPGSVRL